jgi:hypothetical protein
MAEIAPAGGGPNRLFLVIALGLVGLLLLGLIAIGGVFLIPRLLGSSPAPTLRVAVTTPTRNVALAAVTEAPTSTDTPIPTATSVINTPVLLVGSPAATSQITATTNITGTPGAGGSLPQSGLGDDLLLLAGGIILVFIIVASRRARVPGTA